MGGRGENSQEEGGNGGGGRVFSFSVENPFKKNSDVIVGVDIMVPPGTVISLVHQKQSRGEVVSFPNLPYKL